ncbi:unnamed protein product [Tenebrio molitor]|nr:unnamed protein product [Tenebrio molitor]
MQQVWGMIRRRRRTRWGLSQCRRRPGPKVNNDPIFLFVYEMETANFCLLKVWAKSLFLFKNQY